MAPVVVGEKGRYTPSRSRLVQSRDSEGNWQATAMSLDSVENEEEAIVNSQEIYRCRIDCVPAFRLLSRFTSTTPFHLFNPRTACLCQIHDSLYLTATCLPDSSPNAKMNSSTLAYRSQPFAK